MLPSQLGPASPLVLHQHFDQRGDHTPEEAGSHSLLMEREGEEYHGGNMQVPWSGKSRKVANRVKECPWGQHQHFYPIEL